MHGKVIVAPILRPGIKHAPVESPLVNQGAKARITPTEKETTMKEWLMPELTESEAGMEVTSYLPAELDRT